MSTSGKLILHVGNGTTVQMDSPTTFGAIVTKIKEALNLKRFKNLSEIVNIHKLVFYKASGEDEFGRPLSADEYDNDAQITADIIYWRKAIKIYSYGEGVGKGISSKHHLCLIFDSSCPNFVTEQLNSFENEFDKHLALSEADASKKQPPKVRGPLRIVCIPISEQSDRAVPAEAASTKEFLLHNAQSTSGDYMLFYVADKASYSHTTEYQIRKLMLLPAVSESAAGTDYCDRLLSTLTAADLQRFQGHLDGYLVELKENPDRKQRWNSCVRLCFDHLFALQPHFAVLSIYNEATRRLIINEVMQAAAMYCNSTLGVEEIVWKQTNSMKFDNVCGYGPLDYYLRVL
eukprot:scaffold691_cov181-Ochromonas_danica.AAC.16